MTDYRYSDEKLVVVAKVQGKILTITLTAEVLEDEEKEAALLRILAAAKYKIEIF